MSWPKGSPRVERFAPKSVERTAPDPPFQVEFAESGTVVETGAEFSAGGTSVFAATGSVGPVRDEQGAPPTGRARSIANSPHPLENPGAIIEYRWERRPGAPRARSGTPRSARSRPHPAVRPVPRTRPGTRGRGRLPYPCGPGSRTGPPVRNPYMSAPYVPYSGRPVVS
ncbi:hypothetical protein [Streptomyces sp. NPDC058632]|uniref:hypothetical protein n=1 Tax=Streptomyces sp. NPDC058632 TaxID=3346567 RepID=UPI00365A9BA0